MEWNPAVWVRDSWNYVGEVRNEGRKVTWPTQQETVQATMGVIIVVGVITAVLGLFDGGLNMVFRAILP